MFCLGYSLCKRRNKHLIGELFGLSDSLMQVLKGVKSDFGGKDREELKKCFSEWDKKMKEFKDSQ